MLTESLQTLPAERHWRGAGCDERCTTVQALVPGVFGRSELLLHDPDAHEAHGWRLAGPAAASVVTGQLTVDLGTLHVAVDGRPVPVPPTELRLLVALARRPGQAVLYEELVPAVWGPGWTVLDASNVRQTTLNRLRSRLGEAGWLIVTIPGVGLRLDVVPPGAPPRPHAGLGRPVRHRWARDWDACRGCGRTSIPHNGRGYCQGCHQGRHDVAWHAQAPARRATRRTELQRKGSA